MYVRMISGDVCYAMYMISAALYCVSSGGCVHVHDQQGVHVHDQRSSVHVCTMSVCMYIIIGGYMYTLA